MPNDKRLKKIVVYANEREVGCEIHVYESFTVPKIGHVFTDIAPHPYEVFKVEEAGVS